ncbi:MAG: diaminopimelate decarboxylase [Tahibacter sp.]
MSARVTRITSLGPAGTTLANGVEPLRDWTRSIDLEGLARDLPTPFHVYSADVIRARVGELQRLLHGLDAQICYAVKANPSLAILRLMAEAGVGADIVSAGELRRSLRAGIPATSIVFSGVGKTADEIAEALQVGVARFNLESVDELHVLQREACTLGIVARASARINPDVDAHTHAKISTGKADNKFGVSIDEARRWFADQVNFTHVRLDGLHLHIGSQIQTAQPFRAAFTRVAQFWRELVAQGHAIASIDVGGGLGVAYRAGVDQPLGAAEYVQTVRDALRDFQGQLLLEPGRFLVAEAGILLTRVIRIKQSGERRFLILDSAMNDLLRPALYDAWHDMEPVSHRDREPTLYDIVGPVCETGDTFSRARMLPECLAGDLLMIRTTGAYAASMASTYNSRCLAAEVLVDGERHALVRERQSFDAMVAGEVLEPQWRTT